MKQNLLLKHRFLSYATAPQQVNACWGDFPEKFPPTKRKIGSGGVFKVMRLIAANIKSHPSIPSPCRCPASGRCPPPKPAPMTASCLSWALKEQPTNTSSLRHFPYSFLPLSIHFRPVCEEQMPSSCPSAHALGHHRTSKRY
jgi:hypothetical protein